MDEEEYRELFPKSKALIVLETVCKAAVWLVIAFILGFFFLRMWAMSGTKMTKSYLWTEAALDADTLTVWNVPAHATTNTESVFTESDIFFTDEIGQLQFTLRYNESLLRKEAESTGAKEPPADCTSFVVFVLEDDLGNRYTDYLYAADSRYVSHYLKLVFEGLDKEAGSFRLIAYRVGADGKPEEEPLDATRIYASNFYRTAAKVKKPKTADARLIASDAA